MFLGQNALFLGQDALFPGQDGLFPGQDGLLGCWGVAEDRISGLETGGRTTWATVCRPPLWKTAPPSYESE
ncbi:MAG: hypothetical protein LBK25_00735 [Treponema sp.]|nr:hypothetical protein [Treponema sp.]